MRKLERYNPDGKGWPDGGEKIERYDADGKPVIMGGGGGGDVTDASNVGGGAEWFKDLSATILRFRTFISSHLGLVITQNANDITIDLDESQIDHNSLDNLTVADPHTQYVTKATYDANSIVKADSDDTPIVLAVPASRIVARLAAGGIVAATVAEIKTLLAYVFGDIGGTASVTQGGTGSNLSATGPGFLKQATTGADVTVAALAAGDLPAHTHSASNQGGATLTPDTLSVTKTLALTGDITPSTLNGTQQNDYNPTGAADASAFRLDASADTNISGIQGGADGRHLSLYNISTSNITLLHDVTSTSSNRFYCPGSVDLVMKPNTSVWLRYDATSSRWRVMGVYDNAKVDIYTANGTWTKPVGAKTVEVEMIGGGAGGGSGRKGNASTARRGGSGGGGGQHVHHTFLASLLGTSVSITVGAGGTGGASQTTASTNGNDGNDGAATTFGAFLKAGGGRKGLGGNTATLVGGQGGSAWDGINQTAGDGSYGGGGVGGNGGDGTTQGGAGEHGGGGGGGSGGAPGGDGGGSVFGGGGGGYGGGVVGSTNTPVVGGAGGNYQFYGTGGGGSAGSSPSGAGGNGSSPSYTYWGGSGGGGGGPGVNGAANTAGGPGGNGGSYGGGGGGGGVGTGTSDSGKGGDGASGFCLVITYF